MEFIWWNATFEAYVVIILENSYIYHEEVFTIQSTKISPLEINPLYINCNKVDLPVLLAI